MTTETPPVEARRVLGLNPPTTTPPDPNPEAGTLSDPTPPGTWRVMCLGHNPATVIDPDSGGYRSLEAAIGELATIRGYSRGGHPHCDLLIGWFINPDYLGGTLTNVVCAPGSGDSLTPCRHDTPVSAQDCWLDLLTTVSPPSGVPVTDTALIDVLKRLPRCWTTTRLRQLRPLTQAGRRE